MYLEEIILFWIIVLDWIISFKFSIKGHLPNLLFLVSSRSQMVTIVTLWRLPRRLELAFFFALPAGKTTSLVFILTNYQLALWYHQCKEMFFFYCTQTHERTQAHGHTEYCHTDIFILRGCHSQSRLPTVCRIPPRLEETPEDIYWEHLSKWWLVLWLSCLGHT